MGAERTSRQFTEDEGAHTASATLSVAIVGALADQLSPGHLLLNADDLTADEQGMLHRILRRATRQNVEPVADFGRLTPREREISAQVCEGLGNQAIAERLSISEATVRHHLTSIFAKLGVRDRVALVIAAFSRRNAPSNS